MRALAIRSAEAAKNTAEMIDASVRKVDAGVTLNESVRKRLAEIAQSVDRASAMMAEIAAGAKEQETDLAEITGAIDRIGSLTQRTAANAEESASASAELSAQAGEMKSKAAQFKVGDAAATDFVQFERRRSKARPEAKAKPVSRVAAKDLIPFPEDYEAELASF